MLIGIVGKPSSGKSTLLNALCLTEAKMGDYPFTTIKPNRGVALVRVKCPCANLENSCDPRTGECIDGTRYVPVEMLDVAGLVPGASEGKGMGNQFLDDIRQADALIQVVDASGQSDAEGNPVDEYNPVNDIEWLNQELNAWIFGILFRDWDKISRRLEQDRTKLIDIIHDRLSGLGATPSDIKKALMEEGLTSSNPHDWTDENKNNVVQSIREKIFPTVIACNKMDKPSSEKYIDEIKTKYEGTMPVVPTSGLAELTLRTADKDGTIDYKLGDNDFEFIIENPDSNKKAKVLQAIKERLLEPKGSTGVMELLETAVFDLLNMIVAYPVEDATHLTDQDGRILPDVYLIQKGTTAKKFAGKVHSDFEDNFLHGILITDNGKRVSADHELVNGDILKIVSAAK